MPIQQSSYATPRMDLGQALYEFLPDQGRYIGTQVLPTLSVDRQAGTFVKVTRESLLKRARAARADGAKYNKIDLYVEDDTYACKEYGIESVLSDAQERKYRMDFDSELAIARMLWNRLLLEQEVRVEAMVFNTSTWTGSDLYTDNSGSAWGTASNDIISHVLAAKEKVRQNTGMMPNALIVGVQTLNDILVNDDIINRFPGATMLGRDMLEQNLPSIFGLDRLIVGGAVYDSNEEGQDFSGTDIWGNTYAMVARVAGPGASMTEPSIGRTLMWTEDAASLTTVEQYRDETIRSEVYRARQHVDEEIFDPYFGHLMEVN